MGTTDERTRLWAIDQMNGISFDLMHQITSGAVGEEMQKRDKNFSPHLYCLAIATACMSSTRYALDHDKPDIEDLMAFFNDKINDSGLPISSDLKKVE